MMLPRATFIGDGARVVLGSILGKDLLINCRPSAVNPGVGPIREFLFLL